MSGTLTSASNTGRRIRITHNDPQVNNAVAAGYDRLIIERSVDVGITWQEITAPDSRPALVKDQVDYLWFDRMGDPSYRYRVRYFDSKEGDRSDPSEVVFGAGLATQNILTVEQLKKNYFFGIDLTDDSGEALSDAVFQFYIYAAIAWLEQHIATPLIPTTYIDEKYDYYWRDYNAWSLVQLNNYPVISVDRFTVQYPSAGQIVEWPNEWIRCDKSKGLVSIVPTAGTLSDMLVAAGGGYLPSVYAGGLDYLPELFGIDYVAGFDVIPFNLINLIGKIASLGPFNIFGDLIAGAGIASTSIGIDGLSQSLSTTASATNAGFGSRVLQYNKEIKDELKTLVPYFKGIRMHVA